MSEIVVYEEPQETTDQRRRRLATELRLLHQQFNSKLAEVIEDGLDVDVMFRGGDVRSGENCLITNIDVSYQTKRKYYR